MHRANNSPLKRFHRSSGNPGPRALGRPSFLHLFQSLLTSVFLFSRAPFPLAPKIAHVIASTFSRKAANKSTSNDPFVQSTGLDGVRASRNSFVVFEETGLDSRRCRCAMFDYRGDRRFICRYLVITGLWIFVRIYILMNVIGEIGSKYGCAQRVS